MQIPERPDKTPNSKSGVTETLTLVFTDMEESSKQWKALGHSFKSVLDAHDRLLRAAAQKGREIKHTGDGFMLAFERAADAVRFAAAAQKSLLAENWTAHHVGIEQLRVRIGIHTGEAIKRVHPDGAVDYSGPVVNEAARVMDAAHGGQTLLSDLAFRFVEHERLEGMAFRDCGRHELKGVGEVGLYQLLCEGLPQDFTPPTRLAPKKANRLDRYLPPPILPVELEGREWLREWLTTQERERSHGYILVTAPPGVGKTAFFRSWLARKQARGENPIHWFVDETAAPHDVLRSLVYQLHVSYHLELDPQEVETADVETLLPKVLRLVSSLLQAEGAGAAGKVYIYLESVQEARLSRGKTLLELLPGANYPGVVFVLSARTDSLTRWRFSGEEYVHLDLMQSHAAENRKELRLYLDRLGAEKQLKLPPEFLEDVVEATQGCFAMAKHLLTHSTQEQMQKWIGKAEPLPNGFTRYMETLWEKTRAVTRNSGFSVSAMAALLGLIHISHSSLSQEELESILGGAAERGVTETFRTDAVPGEADCGVTLLKEQLEGIWNLAKGLLVEQGRDRDGRPRYDYYQKFMGEYFYQRLKPPDRTLCSRILADGRRSKLTEAIFGAETVQDIIDLIETPDFGEDLSDWLMALLPLGGNDPYLVPVSWYLYGHYWWDEFTPTFAFCTNLLDLLKQNRNKYADLGSAARRRYDMMCRELSNLRQRWVRNSIWKTRRPSCHIERETDKPRWKQAREVCETLLEQIVQRSAPQENAASEDRLEYDIACALLTALIAECLWGEGHYDLALTAWNRAVELENQCPKLEWCLPYALVDWADCLFESGQEAEARQKLTEALKMPVIEDDVCAQAEAFRLYSDLLWAEERYAEAMDACLLSLYLALLGYAEMGDRVDAYLQAFHQEINWSLTDRLLERFQSDPKEGQKLGEQCLDFWQPYFDAQGEEWLRPEPEELHALFAQQRAEACARRLLPATPELGTHFDKEFVEDNVGEQAEAIRSRLERALL